MLKQLYIKNFKGFKEELIELKDVNFLVGENSTGKTSLLKLINVLHQRGFWERNEGFNNNEVELGYFDEIKNKNSKDDFFKIAIESDFSHIYKNDFQYCNKIEIEFYNKSDNPYFKKVKFNKFNSGNDYNLWIKIDERKAMYEKTEFQNLTFEKWVKLKNDKIFNSFLDLEEYSINWLILKIFGIENAVGSLFLPLLNHHSHFKWLAPIRAKAKRTYESFNTAYSPEGDHVPVMIKNLLNGKKDTKESNIIFKALEKFGKSSNLFDQIQVENLGQNGTSTFKINILYNGLPMVLPNVGYGVAQALPLLIEILNSKETLISLQQPEVHLHPRAQAAFGDFVFDSCKKDKNRFLIETHSEYMIDRFRQALNKARSKTKNPTAQVLYFERNKKGNKITAIPIANDGMYEKALPKSYERFFLNEELNTLHL